VYNEAMNEIKVECPSCGGTGVYHGFAEPEGVAVVCLTCGGTGETIFRYKPFTGRKRRKGIHTVQLSRGSFILTGVGPCGTPVSYKEFLSGKMPK
jgi:endogenous inhibitor of DNA gyrase (YacG/DUF329 family)